ncbi:MAG: Maf family protein, partial [Candidatus Binataceae bacterium]
MPSPESTPSLILASGSPRRHALLKAAGIKFTITESGIDERRNDGEDGTAFALRMAREKALSVSIRSRAELVLAADTIVECGGEVLGKPADSDAARRSLRMLAGRTHTVVTAYALARNGSIIESAAVI